MAAPQLSPDDFPVDPFDIPEHDSVQTSEERNSRPGSSGQPPMS